MDAELRREQLLNIIEQQAQPVSASALSKELNVSRQIIVGDVALLRARGHGIIATARGYMIPSADKAAHYLGKIVCRHAPGNTRDELYTIVDLGAVVVNVIVEHGYYGEITGSLNLATRKDVDFFMEEVETSEVKLLSELTMGVHVHTISCRDKVHFEEVCRMLEAVGYLNS